MDTDNLKILIAKYFPLQNINKIIINETRVIVEFVALNENKEKSRQLKQEIAKLYPNKTVNLIFAQEINNNAGINAMEKWNTSAIKHIIGVASGKGGVGKSTTSVNLALALANKGLKVGITDADIYGPSIPKMLGYEGMPMLSKDGIKFEPFNNCMIKSVSIGAMIDSSTPIIWRGVKACSAIEQLLTQTDWQDIDVMIIDMPPGTGDIQITLSQRIDFSGIVIVSTPQDVALIDAIKAINMCKKIGVSVLGIIENMSYYICPYCGQKTDIFGHNGAKKAADELGEAFLGAIPLELQIRETSDNGIPVVAADPESEISKSYEDIAAKIITKLGL